jgi:hypothetical protein
VPLSSHSIISSSTLTSQQIGRHSVPADANVKRRVGRKFDATTQPNTIAGLPFFLSRPLSSKSLTPSQFTP